MSKIDTEISIKMSKAVYHFDTHLVENEQSLIQNEGREYNRYNNTVV